MRFILRALQLLLFPVYTVALVAILANGNHTFDKVVECNSDVSIICKADANTENMRWRLNNSLIFSCTMGSCSPSSSSTLYSFEYNTVVGEFTIRIPQFSRNVSNAEFTCDVIIGAASITLNVTGDYNLYTESKIAGSNTTELTFSTGCISNNAGFHFQWHIVNVTNSTDIRPLPSNMQPVNTTSLSACVSDNSCGIDGTIRHTSTLTIKEENSDADSFFLAVSASYDGLSRHNRERIFKDRSFKIDITTTTTTNISPSKTTTSSVTQTSTSEMKTTKPISNANANTSSTTSLPTTTTNTTTIPTLSTTISASSLPPSPIDNFTPSSSPVMGKEKSQNADKTSTILIIAFSSIAGIALLLIVAFAINKIRKRYKNKSGASNTHEMETDKK